MILIVSGDEDVSAKRVGKFVRQLGGDYVQIDFDKLLTRDCVRLAFSPTGGDHTEWRVDSKWIRLSEIECIYWRRPSKVESICDAAFGDSIGRFISTSWRECITGAFEIEACRQVPCSRSVSQKSQLKIPQLRLAAQVGFALPDTLITNDPDEFLEFYRRHDGRVISKNLAVGVEPIVNEALTSYARRFRARELISFQDLQYCPVIVQAYIEKKLEVRVTVVGEDVFAVEIHSQVTRRTKHDWRRYDLQTTPHSIHSLPSDIGEMCIALVKKMNLHYGAIDLILTPNERYVFLEINPNGQYGWLEDLTGLPISQRIARLLVEGV